MTSLITYLKNVRGELAHVVWPSRNTAMMHTLIVIAVSAVTALLIAGLDYVFTSAVSRLLGG